MDTSSRPNRTQASGLDDDLRATLRSNRAAARLELGEGVDAVRDASAALALLPADSKAGRKARYRRALGRVLTGDLAGAKDDHRALRAARFYNLTWPDLVLRADRVDAANAPLRKPPPKKKAPADDPGALVSVVCPTSHERHDLHEPLLYASFHGQTHAPKELVVVDSGPTPRRAARASSDLSRRRRGRGTFRGDGVAATPRARDRCGDAADRP